MKQVIYIVCFLFFIGCTSRTIYKKPENLIPKDQMVALWTDIYIANSAYNIKNKKLQEKLNYMPLVYEKHKIDSVRFVESNIYYTSHIEEYEKMFKKVEQNLRKIRDQYDPISAGIDPNLPVYVRDSIRRVRREERMNNIKKTEMEEKLLKKSKTVRE